MFALLREDPAEVSSSIRHNVADILSGERAMEHTVAGFGERQTPRQQLLCAARQVWCAAASRPAPARSVSCICLPARNFGRDASLCFLYLPPRP